MFSVPQADVMNALKKFRRLAKQDFLASPQTSNPVFWRLQAEARRAQYDELMQCVTVEGVESAYHQSVRWYTALPLTLDDDADPEILGREQAFEMFFLTLGVDEKTRVRLRNARRSARKDLRSMSRTHPIKGRSARPASL